MEAIKFSELPSGDRMPLADEDGVPIIANQENRLLTWGRLKQQIAAQTHTDTVDESEKIPTAKAIYDALGSLDSDLHDEFNEKIDDAQAKAEGANATAKSALASAGSASRDAQSAENKAIEALNKITETKTATADAISKAETAESKAEEALAKVGTTTVDLTPITEKLNNHEQTFNEIQEAITITNAEGEEFTIKGELSGIKSLALLTKTDADTAKTTANAAKKLADTLTDKMSEIEERFYITKTTTTTDESGIEQTTTETLPLDKYVQRYEDRIVALETEMAAWTSDIKLLIGQLADTLQGLNS